MNGLLSCPRSSIRFKTFQNYLMVLYHFSFDSSRVCTSSWLDRRTARMWTMPSSGTPTLTDVAIELGPFPQPGRHGKGRDREATCSSLRSHRHCRYGRVPLVATSFQRVPHWHLQQNTPHLPCISLATVGSVGAAACSEHII